MSDIFREIDEELRRDNLLKLWSKYGRHIVIVVILALAVAGAVMVWRAHQLSQRQAQSTRYATALALAREGKDVEAAKLFEAIAAEGGGYARLAAFEEPALLAKAGDKKGAVAALDRIAASDSAGPEFRDLATLLSVMYGLPDTDAKAAIERLKPLTAADNPYRPTALELTALARLKEGDKAGALEIYRSLSDDLRAPQSLRGRAAEMAAALGP